MKISSWAPNRILSLSSVKRDVLLIPVLFLINSYFCSAAFRELNDVTARPSLLLVMLYGLAGVVPLAWRDKAPVAVFVILWVHIVGVHIVGVHIVAGWPILPQYAPVLGIAVALYAVALHCDIKTSLLVLLAAFIPGAFNASTALRTDPGIPQPLGIVITNAVIIFVLFLGAWIQGRLTRVSRQHIQRLECERETAWEVVAAERRRIARELHDIVSHAVTVIVLQAAGAARVAKTDFAQVTQSLAHIETTGKQAMGELRRLLGVLEASDPTSHTAGTGEFGPQPGLADLTVLLSSLRAAGMPVTVDVGGTPRDLDPSVDLAAYRIVQEGLTNVLKHAGKDANPRLRLAWEIQDLSIQIDNDINLAEARRGQALSVGRGLVGLRERAHAVGGRVHAGPHHHAGPPHKDGYRLTATLPLAHTAGGRVVTIVSRASSQNRGDQGKVPA